MPDTEKKPQRALITYRTKPLEDGAKLSGEYQRVIEFALDSKDAMRQFWDERIWPAMTASITVSKVSWPDED